MQACNCTSWASICAVIAPCSIPQYGRTSGSCGVVETGAEDSSGVLQSRLHMLARRETRRRLHGRACEGVCPLAELLTPAFSGHDLTLVGRWEDRACTLERGRGRSFVGVDALEDDVVAGVEARVAGRVEHADAAQAPVARLLRLGRRGVAPVRLRQRD